MVNKKKKKIIILQRIQQMKKKTVYRSIMKKIVARILLIGVLSMGLHQYAKAQTDPDNDPDAIPLDPGSWVLVAAGVGYGVKKWRDVKLEAKKNNPDATPGFIREDKMDENCL